MPTSSASWHPQAAQELYRKSVEVCERFLADRKRPVTANGQAFFDLCLAEYAVRKHLSECDCFSSRQALISALKELLIKPVEPPILPCRADQYLACQSQDIEFEIGVLTAEKEIPEKVMVSKIIWTMSRPDELNSGNGAVALWFRFRHLQPAVPKYGANSYA